MGTVSNDIIDKLRQLSDLLVVIKESGNNTPQILKELAVEKCNEIYNALNCKESESEPAPKCEFIDNESYPKNEDVMQDSDTDCFEQTSSLDKESFETLSFEEEITDSNDGDVLDDSVIDELDITSYCDTPEIDNEVDCSDLFEKGDINEDSYSDSVSTDVNKEEIEIKTTEIDSDIDVDIQNDIVIDDDADLFAPVQQDYSKRCNHKKIRSILSINDIFLYKRELFGNSDVDMTDMFDGIDEAESLNDALELITEYFGEDINNDDMIKEFVERVNQCFE